jgi:hypothetical protein
LAPNADVAIVIVAVVALAAVGGTRLWSLTGAAGGALAFATLWARPTGSLRVESPADRMTGVLLFVVGVLLAELVRVRRSPDGVESPGRLGRALRAGPAATRTATESAAQALARARGRARRVGGTVVRGLGWSHWRPFRRDGSVDPLRSVGRVAHEVAEGDDPEFIVLDLARTLVDLLELDDCRFEAAPLVTDRRATLIHSGELELRQHRWSPCQLGLPERGFHLVVAARGQTLGRFVCSPAHHHNVPEERIVAALALVDQAASARLIASVS